MKIQTNRLPSQRRIRRRQAFFKCIEVIRPNQALEPTELFKVSYRRPRRNYRNHDRGSLGTDKQILNLGSTPISKDPGRRIGEFQSVLFKGSDVGGRNLSD